MKSMLEKGFSLPSVVLTGFCDASYENLEEFALYLVPTNRFRFTEDK